MAKKKGSGSRRRPEPQFLNVARVLRPLLRRIFPDVPPEHPAMGSMLMNIAAYAGLVRYLRGTQSAVWEKAQRRK